MAFMKYTSAPAAPTDKEAWKKAGAFVCSKCEAAFASKDELDNHTQTCVK